jgi:hypothetical protein
VFPVQVAVRRRRKAAESHLLHHLALLDPDIVGAPGKAFRCVQFLRYGFDTSHVLA